MPACTTLDKIGGTSDGLLSDSEKEKINEIYFFLQKQVCTTLDKIGGTSDGLLSDSEKEKINEIYFFLHSVCTTLDKIGGTSEEKINEIYFFLHSVCTIFARQKQNWQFAPCACGEIGRRARLRIWCFATCRFESYQAHNRGKSEKIFLDFFL